MEKSEQNEVAYHLSSNKLDHEHQHLLHQYCTPNAVHLSNSIGEFVCELLHPFPHHW